jgi:hypothetical protein
MYRICMYVCMYSASTFQFSQCTWRRIFKSVNQPTRWRQLRTTVENKKRENGEDFNLHPPAPLAHHPLAIPAACRPPGLVFCRARESSYFLRRGGIEKTRSKRAGHGTATRGEMRTGLRRGWQTVGNIIAARAERNYRFALGVPSFFPIPPSSSLESAKASSFFLYPSAFLPPAASHRPGRPPFFQSPGIANNFHNSRLESFPPRAEVEKEHRPLFRSPSRFLRRSPRPLGSSLSVFPRRPFAPFSSRRALFSRGKPTRESLKEGRWKSKSTSIRVPSRRPLITFGIRHSRLNSVSMSSDDGSDHKLKNFRLASPDVIFFGPNVTLLRKRDVNYILARRRMDNDVCESLAELVNAAITRS